MCQPQTHKHKGDQLAELSTLHFLCHDRKDRQHLYHNLRDHVRHCHSRCDASVYLSSRRKKCSMRSKTSIILSSARMFSRLGSLVSKESEHATVEGYRRFSCSCTLYVDRYSRFG